MQVVTPVDLSVICFNCSFNNVINFFIFKLKMHLSKIFFIRYMYLYSDRCDLILNYVMFCQNYTLEIISTEMNTKF